MPVIFEDMDMFKWCLLAPRLWGGGWLKWIAAVRSYDDEL
jgi:hypothetical protein